MAWFGTKKQQTDKGGEVNSLSLAVEEKVLTSPRITEKASLLAEQGAYTFNVPARVTKNEVARAVEAIYKVRPVKVRMVNIPDKVVTRRRIKGRKSRGKKAYVYLKKGDTIEL